jgi:phosphate transport system substrate-binding protein
MNSHVLAASLVFALAAAPAQAQDRIRLQGSGASFPAPIYAAWFKDFSAKNKGLTVDYQSKGSGAGVQDFLNKTVDFAGSDSAMKAEDMAKVPGGAQLLPITGGEVVLAYNLPGNPKGLKLPRDVYPQIFLGKITKWNDPKLQAANPSIKLPDTPITVVRRADSSGTTYVLSLHLAAVSEEWKKEYGVGNTVNWPKSDKFIATPKNDGVAATIKQTPGSIGYMEWGFAKLSKAETALLQNKAGQYVAGGTGGGADALAATKLPADLIAWLPDPDGAKSYPITSYTWLIFSKKNADPKKAAAMRSLVEYCLTEGQKAADRMGYIPLPQNVVAEVRKAAANIQ